MARSEHEREDLLADASALVERVSLRLPGSDDGCVAGFRRDDSASFYFGADPVYQFTSDGQLRRAFVGGLLYKAVGGNLAALQRQRRAKAVELIRHDLSPVETQDVVDELLRRLGGLRDVLTSGRFQVVGVVPQDADVVGRVRRWLAAHASEIAIARSPHAR